MTEKLFDTAIAYMAKMYGHAPEAGVLAMYWQALKDWSDDAFQTSCRNIVKQFRPTRQVPFPLVADFYDSVGETGKKKAQNIVSLVQGALERSGVYQDIDFGDTALHAVIERFGGWPELGRWTYEDWRFRAKEFTEAYEGAQVAGIQGPAVLSGLTTLHSAQGSQELPDKSSVVKIQTNRTQSIGSVVAGILE